MPEFSVSTQAFYDAYLKISIASKTEMVAKI